MDSPLFFPTPPCSISVTFKDEKDGSETTVQAPLGKSLLEVAHENGVELEGACEGSLACSTCHVIVEDQVSRSRHTLCGWTIERFGPGCRGMRNLQCPLLMLHCAAARGRIHQCAWQAG